MVTDGNTGLGSNSLKESLATLNQRSKVPFPVPFSFPGKLHIVCLTPTNDFNFIKCKYRYDKTVDILSQVHAGHLQKKLNV